MDKVYGISTTHTRIEKIDEKIVFMLVCKNPWSENKSYMYEVEIYFAQYDVSGQVAVNPIYYRNAGNYPINAQRGTRFESFKEANEMAVQVFDSKVEMIEWGLL